MLALISLLYLFNSGNPDIIPVDMGKYGTRLAICNGKSDVSAFMPMLFGKNKALDSSNITFIKRTLGGLGYCVFVKDTLTYYSEGGMFLILNTSGSANPVLLGELSTPSLINNIYVSGDYAYISNREAGLRIVNVSDPIHPVETGAYAVDIEAWSCCVSGNYAYVIDMFVGQLQVLDVQDPANPVLVGVYGLNQLFGEIYVSGNYAYITDRGLGTTCAFIVLDISDPAAIRKVSSLNLSGYASGICVKDTFAYIAAGSAVRILNIADTIPKLVKVCNTYSYAYDICVNNNYVYAGEVIDYRSGQTRLGRLEIIDVSVPESARIVGIDSNTAYGTYGISYFNNHIYGACGIEGLRIINVSDADSPVVAGTYNTCENIAKIGFYNDHLFALDYTRSVKVLDVSNPQQAQKVLEIPASLGLDIDVEGNCLYAGLYADSLGDSGIMVKDISNPLAPVDKGAWVVTDTTDTAYFDKITAANNYIYIFNSSKSIEIMDDSLNKVGSYSFPYYTFFLCADSNYVYTSDYVGKKLYAINVSNPAVPESAGIWAVGDYPSNMSLSGRYAYVATSNQGVKIVDVSRPDSMKEIGSYLPSGGWSNDVYVSDKYAYVTDYISGVSGVNVSDPAFPQEVGYYFIDLLPFMANLGFVFMPVNDVYASGEYIYVVNSDCGVYIFKSYFPGVSEDKMDMKGNLSLKSFPNPGSQSTLISYHIPVQSGVSLKLYDLSGRCVKTLINGEKPAGSYDVKLNAKELGSGVYFVKLTTGKFKRTKKLILMK